MVVSERNDLEREENERGDGVSEVSYINEFEVEIDKGGFSFGESQYAKLKKHH